MVALYKNFKQGLLYVLGLAAVAKVIAVRVRSSPLEPILHARNTNLFGSKDGL